MLARSRDGRPPQREGPDAGPRRIEELLSIIPPNDRQPYEMRKVIEHVVDEGSFLEIQPLYGRSVIVGMAFLGGRAVAIVAREQKASTSFVQRHLQIGYNRAARIIEQMEKEGVISTANHVGKREVLISDHSGE